MSNLNETNNKKVSDTLLKKCGLLEKPKPIRVEGNPPAPIVIEEDENKGE